MASATRVRHLRPMSQSAVPYDTRVIYGPPVRVQPARIHGWVVPGAASVHDRAGSRVRPLSDLQTARKAAARLFAYGTLRPGQRNHRVLAPLGGNWRPATLPGRLIWKNAADPARAYPGLAPGGEAIPGLILESTALPQAWPALDAFEGIEYIRRLALCDAGGEALLANVYLLRDPESFGP